MTRRNLYGPRPFLRCFYRCTPAAIVHCVELTVGNAQELVRPAPVLALLFLKRLQHLLAHVDPQIVKDAGVARHLPVLIGQSQWIAERVDLVLAFVEFGLHSAVVLHPASIRIRVAVEGVGVGVETDVARVDKGVGGSVAVLGVVHGGVKGVGEAVLKHPGQIRAVLEQFLHLPDLLFDDVRPEESFFG